jgi:hypothetical protein
MRGKRGPDEGDTGEGGDLSVSIPCHLDAGILCTYASSTTPIRKLEAVPNRPMHQVTNGDTSRAIRAVSARSF